RLGRTYRCTRTRRSRVPSRLSASRWRCRFWADYTTNISERKFPTGTGGLFQMAVDMRPLTREELVRSLPRELERLARSPLGRLRTEGPPLGAPPSSSHRSMDLALSFGVSGGLECLSAIIPCSCLIASLSRKRRRAFSPALAADCWVR